MSASIILKSAQRNHPVIAAPRNISLDPPVRSSEEITTDVIKQSIPISIIVFTLHSL